VVFLPFAGVVTMRQASKTAVNSKIMAVVDIEEDL
jgi:hypothetical protein